MNLQDIKVTIHRSGTGMVVLSKTVGNALNSMYYAGRKMISVQDVTFVINNNIKLEYQKVEEKKVQQIMKSYAKDMEKGYRYHSMYVLKSFDGYFFQYGK